MTDTAVVDKPTVNWETLLAAATTEDKNLAAKRVAVAVPPAVLALVKNARDNGKRINLPYDAATFSGVCDVFYSAGDLLEPKASVSIARVKVVDGKETVLKAKDSDDGVSKIRISIGSRRGQKGDKAADKAVDAGAKSEAADAGSKGDG